MKRVQLRMFQPRHRDLLAYLSALFPARRGEIEELMAAKGIQVMVAPLAQRRSLNQNALYFAWCQIIGDHLGMTKDETHFALKGRLLGLEETKLGPVPRSSADLSTVAFTDYMEAVSRFAAMELELRLPVTSEEFDLYEAGQFT